MTTHLAPAPFTTDDYAAMAKAVSPYGDGSAARRIREWVFAEFGLA